MNSIPRTVCSVYIDHFRHRVIVPRRTSIQRNAVPSCHICVISTMEFRNVTEPAAAAITLSKNNSVDKGPADKGNQPLAFRGIGDPTVADTDVRFPLFYAMYSRLFLCSLSLYATFIYGDPAWDLLLKQTHQKAVFLVTLAAS